MFVDPCKRNRYVEREYYVSFIDDATSFRHAYFIRHKSDVAEKFVAFEKIVWRKAIFK